MNAELAERPRLRAIIRERISAVDATSEQSWAEFYDWVLLHFLQRRCPMLQAVEGDALACCKLREWHPGECRFDDSEDANG